MISSAPSIYLSLSPEGSGEAFNILRNFGLDKEKIYAALQNPRRAPCDGCRAESKYRSCQKYGRD